MNADFGNKKDHLLNVDLLFFWERLKIDRITIKIFGIKVRDLKYDHFRGEATYKWATITPVSQTYSGIHDPELI